ncbi:MAG: DUF4388 domain-containing protein, partial [Nannocystaceae bacterium]
MSDSAAGAQGSKPVSLGEVSVPRLLFALLRQRFSGTVQVQQPPPYLGERTVWFRGGMPVFTDWSAPTEVLGQVLIAHRLIDEDQLLRALEAMAAQGGLLGQHLMTQGAIDRRHLLEGLRQQCSRKLLQSFSLRAGQVRVTPGNPTHLDADLLPVNVLALVLAGVSAAYDEERVAGELGPIVHASVQTTSSLSKYREHFRFRDSDEPLLAALARGSGLPELAMHSPVGTMRAAQVVYTLWACQMLRVQPGTMPAQPPTSVPPRPAPSAPPTPTAAEPAPAPQVIEPVAAVPPARARHETSADIQAQSAAAEASDTAAPSDEAFIAELEALEHQIDEGAHAFDLFGLELGAGKREVRRAWGDLSRKFHPDALKRDGRDSLRERVGAVFAALSEAQQILSDTEQRDKLRQSIERGEHETTKDGKDATAQAHAVFQSELLAKEADKLLRANRFDRALERYREATRYNDDEPDLQAAIAWCEYQVSSKSPAESLRAHDQLKSISERAPRLARAQYFLGFVLVDQNNPAAAIDAFGKAAKLDPRLIDAERQARALKMKLGRPREAPGGTPGDKGKRGGLRGL